MRKADIAVIAAAGWKYGALPSVMPEWEHDFRLPEPLFPLPDGNTIVQRLVKQLKLAGVSTVVVAVGHPNDYLSGEIAHKLVNLYGTCPGEGSPWSWERVEHIWEIGALPLLLHNPLSWSRNVTMRKLLEHIAPRRWDTVLGLAGDYVFETKFLHELIAKAVWPSVHWVIPRHDMLFLDRPGYWRLLTHMQDQGDTASGSSLWRRRALLKARGVKSTHALETAWMAYAPWVGHGELSEDTPVKFVDVGTEVIAWEAAQSIAKEDPV
jgi:hypothetical protein